ncbi:hypothetical protein BJY00DRAFT_297615 [Aspergillus carlsbadensis]|nr:hypothetical protein BJY00DRAFT_297615 [Aspergillus carlsbadensis]
MSFVLPSCFASSANPTQWLILCAPVWFRSSRFTKICAPPSCVEMRFRWWMGVGRPWKVARTLAISRWKSGVSRRDWYAWASSSRAGWTSGG